MSKKIDLSKLNVSAIRKAAKTITQAKPVYEVTECLQFLKNLYTKPVYKQLTISNYAWIKLMAFIHLVGEYEISGFGRIKDETVIDFDIIRQEVKSAYVESDADSVLEFIMNTKPEERSEWILDWHSHVNMGTTPSTTDWTNYYEMLTARQNKQFPAIIVNKKGCITANQIICEGKYTEIKMFVDTTPLSEDKIEEIYNICKEKVENYCTKAATTSWSSYGALTDRSVGTGYQGYSSYYDYDDYDDYYFNRSQKKTLNGNEDEKEQCRVNAFDLTQEQIRKMEANGIVFDEETGEAYEEDECCQMCLKPLKTETELDYGVCLECFQKAMQKEALGENQNSKE